MYICVNASFLNQYQFKHKMAENSFLLNKAIQ